MQLYEITIPKDDAWEVMNALGKEEVVHFIDLNKGEQVFNLPYQAQISRCEETQRRILYTPHFSLTYAK
jgi:vacuolar-type H+-ATPase subunit I/STV1